MIFRCEIPGRAGIKKNSRRHFFAGGRPVSAPSKRYEVWKQTAIAHIKQRIAHHGAFRTIDFPVILKCTFCYENRKNEQDLSNAYQGVEDILQELKLIENDKLIYGHDGSRKIFGGENKTIIEIFRMEEK